MPCGRCVARRVRCQVPEPVIRRQVPNSQAQGRSIESLLASLSNTHDRQLLPLSLIEKIRTASPTNISEWRPRANLVIPSFPFISLPTPYSITKASLGGGIYTEESEAGYWPVEQTTTLDSMWAGQDPERAIASPCNRLYL